MHRPFETAVDFMDRTDKQDAIHRFAAENRLDPQGARVLWSRHATARLIDYGLSRTQVEAALMHCVVIEDYPTAHRPLADCLVLGYLDSGDPLHAVVAVDEAGERLFIVTVYPPALERWQSDWRTRKQ